MKTTDITTSVTDDQPKYRRLVDEIKGNKANCQHCGREIVRQVDGGWIDPQATGDDSIWRDTCDSHDTFTAEHEPTKPIDIIVEGGVIQDILNIPKGVTVRVIDYDIDGCDPEHLSKSPYDDEEAVVEEYEASHLNKAESNTATP